MYHPVEPLFKRKFPGQNNVRHFHSLHRTVITTFDSFKFVPFSLILRIYFGLPCPLSGDHLHQSSASTYLGPDDGQFDNSQLYQYSLDAANSFHSLPSIWNKQHTLDGVVERDKRRVYGLV